MDTKGLDGFRLYWVALKELDLRYFLEETLLLRICICIYIYIYTPITVT